ncbi:Putative preQ0 transporter [plant metagenome]|uniref:PreQ0 transporter n=1 Tax=plant metagenome TaxID=1297885 RepID=A0A484RDZ0_9ZZZZ
MQHTPSPTRFAPLPPAAFALAVLAMGIIVVGSNFLVQFPINDWLTWGALTYPVAFLVTDLLNRRYGPAAARRVAWIGFALALGASVFVASPRIALASGVAYLCAQMLDIHVFDRLREGRWWRAPLVSGALAATLDTSLFFGIAFAATGAPWITWLLGDLMVKLAVNAGLLAPFRALMWNIARPADAGHVRG